MGGIFPTPELSTRLDAYEIDKQWSNGWMNKAM